MKTVQLRCLTWHKHMKPASNLPALKVLKIYYKVFKNVKCFMKIRIQIWTSHSDPDPVYNCSDPQHCTRHTMMCENQQKLLQEKISYN